MKKRCLVVIMTLMMAAALMMGCSKSSDKKESDKKVTSETNKKDKDTPEKKDDAAQEDAGEVVQSPDALNVAEDTFEMADLVSKAGGSDADLLALLGVQESAEVYNTKLFGADTSITVTSADGIVQSIQMVFASVANDSLVNAVSEQLGQDGTVTDGTTSWTYEGASVVLSQGDQGCVIDISK